MNMYEKAWEKTIKDIINELDGLQSEIGSPYYMYLTYVLQYRYNEKNFEASKKLTFATWGNAIATGLLTITTVILAYVTFRN
jgi:hypothetical protein